jgi:VWFA-related protein
LAGLAIAASTADAQVFSSRVEAVRVDVLVTERGKVVRGLGPGDFELLDNGVPQHIDLVTFERLPLNVVLVLDMSGSVAGERLEHLRTAGLAVLEQLAPEDEAALVTFSHAVIIAAPFATDRAMVREALQRVEGFGRTALVDASQVALALDTRGAGRSLIIVFSDGVDTASWLAPDQVLETARRTDAVVYGVTMRGPRKVPFVSDLAAATGGALIEIGSTGDLHATFLRILEEFRQRYVVSYTPRGVSGAGWHRLDVRVKGRRVAVRARPGYVAP